MEKSNAVTISVKAPIDPKPEKEEKKEEEDGFTTPTGPQFKIPPPVKCPPAPRRSINRKTIDKRRRKSTGRRLTSVKAQDLNTIFARTQT